MKYQHLLQPSPLPFRLSELRVKAGIGRDKEVACLPHRIVRRSKDSNLVKLLLAYQGIGAGVRFELEDSNSASSIESTTITMKDGWKERRDHNDGSK